MIGREMCATCGDASHGDAPCRSRAPVEPGESRGAPCSCLPAPAGSAWRACASCGLPQAPGKAFCDFCGSRWVDEPADAGRDGARAAPEARAQPTPVTGGS